MNSSEARLKQIAVWREFIAKKAKRSKDVAIPPSSQSTLILLPDLKNPRFIYDRLGQFQLGDARAKGFLVHSFS